MLRPTPTHFSRIVPLLLATSIAACGGGGGQNGTEAADPSTSSAAEATGAAAEPSTPDWSSEWWYKTYGDDAVLADDSTVGIVLNRTEQRDDYSVGWTAKATFQSKQGSATLLTSAGWPEGKNEETIELTAEEYTQLWSDVLATGWVADAMAGKGGEGFGSGTEVYLIGAAGPDGLGWTVSGTRAAFEGFPSTARFLELLLREASSRSSVFVEGLELVEQPR